MGFALIGGAAKLRSLLLHRMLQQLLQHGPVMLHSMLRGKYLILLAIIRRLGACHRSSGCCSLTGSTEPLCSREGRQIRGQALWKSHAER